MFGKKRTIAEINRSWRNIIFLVVFVAAGFALSGLGQMSLNESKEPAPQSIEIQVNDYEEEESNIPEKIEVVDFKPVKYMTKMLIY
jgi:hypothetical protein